METNLYNKKVMAEDLFLQKRYKDSMVNYANILQEHPDDKDARIGAILSDMAVEKEDEAQAIFDYYLILKKRTPQEAALIVEEVIDSFDFNTDKFANTLIEALEIKANEANGVSYKDFKELVKKDGNFKKVFENIMFSTKIIIIGKDEFIDFLNNLIEYGFSEMALNYLDGAIEIFINDPQIRKLFDKLREKNIEN